jgi:hypothetical protein
MPRESGASSTLKERLDRPLSRTMTAEYEAMAVECEAMTTDHEAKTTGLEA